MAKDEKNYTQEALEEQLKIDLESVPDLNLSDLDLSEFAEGTQTPITPYTTELLEKLQELDPSLTADQMKSLMDYAKGSGARPDFAESLLTQTNTKLAEILKIMSVLQLLQIPALYDYLSVLRKNTLNPDTIKTMSYADISTEAANIRKEINDILQLGIKIVSSLSKENQIPTKVEKLANAIMGCSESTRKRIEEIIEDSME